MAASGSQVPTISGWTEPPTSRTAHQTIGRRGRTLRAASAPSTAPTPKAEVITAQVVAPSYRRSATTGPSTSSAGSTTAW